MRDEFNSRNTRVYNNNSKYPQGYIPKIQYWNGKLQGALTSGDWAWAEHCMKKLNHFVSRQYVKENQVTFTQIPPSASKEWKLSSKGLTRVR